VFGEIKQAPVEFIAAGTTPEAMTDFLPSREAQQRLA